MTIVESTMSGFKQGELEGMGTMLRKILRKIDELDARLTVVENRKQKCKEMGMERGGDFDLNFDSVEEIVQGDVEEVADWVEERVMPVSYGDSVDEGCDLGKSLEFVQELEGSRGVKQDHVTVVVDFEETLGIDGSSGDNNSDVVDNSNLERDFDFADSFGISDDGMEEGYTSEEISDFKDKTPSEGDNNLEDNNPSSDGLSWGFGDSLKGVSRDDVILRDYVVFEELDNEGFVWLYGAKPCNVNAIPYVDLDGNVSTRSVNAAVEKGQNLGLFFGHSRKDEASQMTSGLEALRKPVLLQQAIPAGSHGNILHGPVFIFLLSQQHAATVAAASVRSGSSKSLNINNVASTPSDKPIIVTNYTAKEKQFAAEELSSLSLIKMREIAEAYLGSTINNAVATVFAFFNDYVEFDTLTLDTLPPTFHGMKVYLPDEKELIIELSMKWAGNPNIIIAAKAIGLRATVQVVDLQEFASPRVTLKPLVPAFPCFFKIFVSLMKKPQVDFGLKLLGADVMAFPGLYRLAQELIEDQVANMYLWPKYLEVSVLNLFKTAKKPVGILTTKVLKGSKLKKGLLGKLYPYVKIKLTEDTLSAKKTIGKHSNMNPEWNEEFNLVVKHVIRPLVEHDMKSLQRLMPEIPMWVKNPDYGRVDWLNKFLLMMWPYWDKAICKTMKTTAMGDGTPDTGMDVVQRRLMFEDECIVVDENDLFVGHDTKYNCHLMEKIESENLLHRSFSVFLFNSKYELLLQQRYATNVTFFLVWTNTCCSHALFRDAELIEDNALGVRNAAPRKLLNELGIPANDVPIDQFIVLGRMFYRAPLDGNWGEHELEYLLFIVCDVSIHPHPDEMADVKYVNSELLKELLWKANAGEGGLKLSPWFWLVVDNFLFKWWDRMENGSNQERSPLYYGPYRVLDKVGGVAYRLQLPKQPLVHSTIRSSKLKKSAKAGQLGSTLLPVEDEEVKTPECILDMKMFEQGKVYELHP